MAERFEFRATFCNFVFLLGQGIFVGYAVQTKKPVPQPLVSIN